MDSTTVLGVYFPDTPNQTVSNNTLSDSIESIHYYSIDRNNWVLGEGYLNSANFSIKRNFNQRLSGIRLGLFDNSTILSENTSFKLLRSKVPVTSIFYMNSPDKGDQFFKFYHSQTIFNKIDLNFGMNRTRSSGDYENDFYKDQTSLLNRSYLNLGYQSKFYSSNFHYKYSRWQDSDNGGILLNDSIDNRLVFKNSFDRYIYGAKSETKYHLVNFNNEFNILPNDTSTNNNNARFGYVILDGSYFKSKLTHFDDDTSSVFYNGIVDTTGYQRSFNVFNDSVHFNKYDIKFGWSNTSRGKSISSSKLGYILFGRYQHFQVIQNFWNFKNYNYSLGFSVFHDNPMDRFNFYIGGEYFLDGYNQADFKLFNDFSFAFDSLKNSVVSISSVIQSSEQDIFYNRFVATELSWDNQYDKLQEIEIKVDYSNTKYRFNTQLAYFLSQGLVYFNYDTLLSQSNNPISRIQLTGDKVFNVLKHVFVHPKVLFQSVSNDSIIPVPRFSTNTSVYYKNYLFKRALIMTFGVDVFYFTKFYSYQYLPLYRHYFNQRNKEVGNYPFIDFFVAAEIKNAQLFVKLSHLNSDLINFNYQHMPNYPFRERMVQLGIKWNFYN